MYHARVRAVYSGGDTSAWVETSSPIQVEVRTVRIDSEIRVNRNDFVSIGCTDIDCMVFNLEVLFRGVQEDPTPPGLQFQLTKAPTHGHVYNDITDALSVGGTILWASAQGSVDGFWSYAHYDEVTNLVNVSSPPPGADEDALTDSFQFSFEGNTYTVNIVINQPPAVVGPPSAGPFTRGMEHTFDVANDFIDPNGDTLTYTLDPSTVMVGSESTTAVSIDGSTVTIDATAVAGTYTIPVEAEDGGGLSVIHNYMVMVTDTTAPVLENAVVNGDMLTLTYDELLDEDSVPATTAFTLVGTAATVNAVVISGSMVTLTLSEAVSAGGAVTVGYTRPDVNPLQDVAGNDAATFTPQTLFPPPPTSVTVTADAPGALEVSWMEPDPLPANGYEVQYRIDDGSDWLPETAQTVSADTAGATIMHTFTSLAAGMYHARVRAVYSSVSDTSPWEETSSLVQVDVRTVVFASEIREFRVNRNGIVPLGCTSSTRCNIELQFRGSRVTTAHLFRLTDAPDHGLVSDGSGNWLPQGNTVAWEDIRNGDWQYYHHNSALNLSGSPSLPTDADENALTDSFQFSFEGTTYTVDIVINQPPVVVDNPSTPGPFTAGTAAEFDVADDFTDPNGDMLYYGLDLVSNSAGDVVSGVVSIDGSLVTIADTATADTYTIPVQAEDSGNYDGDTLTFSHPYTVTLDAPPMLERTEAARPIVFGNTLDLEYDKSLDESSVPAGDDFAIGGVMGVTVSAVTINDAVVSLTLSRAVVFGDVVTVSYTPSTNPLQDEDGNNAAALTDESVENLTPPVPTGLMTSSAAAGELEVSWTEPSDFDLATGYNVQYRSDGDMNWLPEDPENETAVTAGGTITHVFTGLAVGMYHARVRTFYVLDAANSAWVETSDSVQVDGYTVRIDSEIRVNRNGGVRIGCTSQISDAALCPMFNLEVQFRGVTDTTDSSRGLPFELTDAPDHGHVSDAGGGLLSVEETVSWIDISRGDWFYRHHNNAASQFAPSPLPSGADEDALTDSFEFSFEGMTYTVNLVINQPPVVVATPSAPGPFKAGTEATFEVADDFTDPNDDTLTYALGTVSPTTAVSIDGSTVTIGTAGTAGTTYTIPVVAEDGGGLSVTHNYMVELTGAPVLSGALVGGNLLVLTYDENLDGGSVPAVSDFTIGGVMGVTVTTVTFRNTAVILTLSQAVTSEDVVTVTYRPGTNPLQDGDGNDAAALMDEPVQNFTPPVPTGVTATSDMAGELEVSWTEPDDISQVSKYHVQYRIDGSANWEPATPRERTPVTAGDPIMYTFTGLTAGTYHARVRSESAVLSSVTSGWVETSSPVTINATPPTGVTTTADAAGALEVSWTAADPAPADGYHVQYRIDGDTNWLPDPEQDVAAGTTTHTFTGLAAGMYHARVRSAGTITSAWVETTGTAVQVDVRTVSIDSEIRVERNAFVPLGCIAPDDCNLEVQFDGMQEDPATPGLQFTLTDAPDHGRVSNGRGAAPLSVGETILWSLVRGGDAGGTWTYNHYAEAINALGSVPPSGADEDALTDSFQFLFEGTIYTVNLVINQPPVVVASPSEPGPFTAGTEATFDVASDFTDPNGDVLTYELGTLAGPMTGAVDISGSTVTIDTTATAGTYTIPVMAMESPDDGGLSVTHEYVVVVSGVAPTGVTATANPANAAGRLAVSWIAPSTAPSGGYHVQHSNDGGANWEPVAPGQVVAMDTTSHTFRNLAAGAYSTRVRAVYGADDTSAWVQGTAVQVDVRTVRIDSEIRVDRNGDVRLGCTDSSCTMFNLEVQFRGVRDTTTSGLRFRLTDAPAHGQLDVPDGSGDLLIEGGSAGWRGISVHAEGSWRYYHHRSAEVNFGTDLPDTSENELTDRFQFEFEGATYTVVLTIVNPPPRVVGTPSAGPYTAGTGGTFDVSGDFTDAFSETLTYELGTVTGTVGTMPGAVTFMDSTVTIGTGATAGTYNIPVTASDGLLDTTYTYTVVVNPEPESNSAPTVVGTPSEPGPFTAGTEATFGVAADFDDSDTSDTLSYATGTVTGPVPTAVTLTGSTVTIDDTATAGTYSIPVVATDNGTPALSVTHVYQVVVEAVNRAPEVVAEPSVPGPFLAGVEGTFDVSGDFSDPDGDTLTYSLGTVSPASSAVMLATGTSVVTVGTGATAGTYTVPVTVADSDSDVTHTYSVEVLATPEVSIRAVTTSVAEGTLATFRVVAEPPPSSALTVMLDVGDGAGDFISGTAPTQVTVGTGGTATFTVPTVNDRVGEADGRITATVTSGSGYTVGAPSSATVTVTDDDDPEVSITAGATVTEGGDATFTVRASKAPVTSLFVNVSVDDGVGDFISGPAPQMVTIAAGSTSATLTVSTVDDSMNEADGRITATLAPGTGYTVAAPPAHQATVTVSDDDEVEVRITAGDSPITEGEAATFAVSASTASASALTVNVNVVDSGSFLSGTAPTTVTIPARQTSAVLSVATQDDGTDEPGGTITVTVTASAGYTVGTPSSAVVVVNDNDGTADPTVTITAGGEVTEGADAEFTVTANPAPTSALTVNVNVTQSGSFISGTLSTTVMIPANMTTATLTVSTMPDTIDELDGTVTATLTSGTGYMVGASSSATVTVTDDDDPVVSIAAGASSVGEGTSALFEVSASTVQASDLVVNVNVAETAGFVPAGETGVQTVTIPSGESSVTLSVPTVDDRIDEADGTIAVRVESGSGYRVAGRPNSTASVTVTDNDEAGITVTPTSGLTTTEAGGTDTFTVVLDSEPTANVVISVSSSDTGEGTVSTDMLTFTDGNWDDPQTVTVTGVDDSIDDGTVDYTIMLAAATSTDPNYGGVSGVGAVDPADVSVSNADDDGGIEPTVTITAGTSPVTEGTAATFTVTASPAPTSALTVNVSVTESGSFLSGTLPTTVEIPANMTTATLTVSTVADSIDEMDGTITAELTPDTGYRVGTPSSAQVAVTDDDTAGITVMPTSGLTTTEAGGQATFTVVLDSEPTASVSIGVSSSDTTEGTVSTTTLMFTSTTWDAAQTVTVTGVDDSVDDGDQTYTIELAAAVSTDPNYSGEDPTDVSVSNTDDDVAGITVAPTTGLTTTEAGGMATFTVVLDSEPTASVSIGVSSSDTTEGTVLPTTLMFTDSTWNQPQTVTVTGVNDPMTDDDQTYMILLAAATSMDADYSGEDPDDVSVTNTDDDGPGITVTPTSGLTTTEAGGTATFTVVLNTQPTADVSIGVSSSDTGEGTVMPTSLTFMNTTWNNAQTVTVTGVNDDVFDGPQMYTIELAAASSTDTNYNNLDPVDVSVSNTDNDTAPTSITLTVNRSSLSEGDSATDVTVTATLDGSTVSTATTVALSLGGGAVNGTDYNATAPTITIAAEMATGTATFAITPVDDSDGEGDETIEIGGTATGGFSGTVNPVTVTLTDNDADIMAPTLSTATVNGNTLVLTYSETLDAASTPAATAFTLGGTTAGVNTVAISGAMVTLTLSAAVASTDVVTVTYTVPTAPGANPLRDVAGNNAAALSTRSVTNNTPAVTPPSVSISAVNASVAEGADATFTVTATTAPPSALTVNVNVVDSGTFATASETGAQTVTIPMGMTTATLAVSTVDDGTDELDGTITATVETGMGYTVAVAPGNSAVVTVTDDDEPEVSISAVAASVAEGADATFTVTATTAPPSALTVNVNVVDNGAFASSSDTGARTVTIAMGTTTATLTVSTVDDTTDEANDTITATVTTGSGYTVAVAPGNSAMVTVTDDDGHGITVTPTSGLTTTESGGTATFTVVLATQPTMEVSIGVSSSDTGEGMVSPDTLTFTNADWDNAKTVTVTGVDDNVDDGNRMYTIELAAAVSTDPNYSGEDPTDVSVSNTDDDAAPTSITLTVLPNTLGEGDSATNVTVTATLDGGTTVSAATTVALSLGGTATGSGTDYSATASTITIAAETATGMATFSITPMEDNVVEGAENIVVSGTATGGFSGTVNSATVTLTDNDVADTTPPTLSTATVNGNTLVLTYDEALDTASVPAASVFTLGGTSVSVNTVAISGMTVTLTLSAAVTSTDVVTVSYTAPGTNPLQDVAGNDAADLTTRSVTNNTPAADATPPTLSTATVNGNTLVLTYNEALDAGSVPAGGDFMIGGVTSVSVNTVAISGMTVTLTLSAAVTSTDVVTVTYTAPGTNPLQDVAGNDAADLTTRSVTNNTPAADATPPTLSTAVVNGNMLVLTYDEALDTASVPAAMAFTVGGPVVSVNTVAISGMTVTLTLSAAVTSTDVVTVTYTAPGTNPLQDVAGNDAADLTTRSVTNNTPAADATPPTLSTATVNGNTLVLTYNEALDTASTPAASVFTLGGTSVSVNTVAISGMTVTLTLSAAVTSTDVVTVTYTAPGTNPLQDVAGNDAADLTTRSVTNNTPAADATPPTLSTAVVNGNMLVLTYNEALDTASTPAASVFTLGGTSVSVNTVAISGMTVTLTLSAAVTSTDVVTVTYTAPGTNPLQDVAGNDAADLTTRSVTNNTPAADATPPTLSTATVNGNTLVLTYNEALDAGSVPAAMAFTVGGPVVSVNTVAISGTRVTLTLSQAVAVGDVVTVTYTAPGTNPLQDVAGNDAGDLVDRSVTNDTPAGPTQMEQVAAREETLTSTLSGTGRLAVVATVDVLSTRFQQRVAGAGRRQSLTLAGKVVDLEGLREDGERHLAEALRDWRNVTLEDLMSSSAFELALTGDATGRGGGDGFVLWGQGDWLDFNSKPQDTFSMDGNVLSGHIGVDYQLGRMLLGMALGHSSGEVDYVNSATGGSRGTVDSELLSIYPYVHFSPDGAGEDAVWAMVGFGVGNAEVTREGRTPTETDIEMRMFGLGVRTGVYAEGDLELALKADGFYAETESDALEDLPSVDSDSVRGRLALELGHRLEQAAGALNSSLEVAARMDAGDAEEGVGGEVGIGLGYTSLLGLDIEVRGRYLVAHSEEDFDEWGASVTVRYDTTRTGGQGFTFELAPGWGDANSRTDSMWEDTYTLSGTARQGARSLGPDRLDLQMGYGLGLRGWPGLLTPFSELSLAGQSSRRVRLGVRLDLPGGEPGADVPVQLELSGEHDAAGGRAADQRFELTATLRL